MVFEFPPWELKTPIFVNQDYPDSREWEKGYWAWNPNYAWTRLIFSKRRQLCWYFIQQREVCSSVYIWSTWPEIFFYSSTTKIELLLLVVVRVIKISNMFAKELVGNSTSNPTQKQTLESDDQRVISDTSSAASVLNSGSLPNVRTIFKLTNA